MGSMDLNWEPQSGSSSPDTLSSEEGKPQSPEELQEEGRKIRRLQMVVNMVTQVIAQDPNLGASVRQTRFCEAKPGGS